MSDEARQTLTITLGEQSFRIRVAPGEAERLDRAARLAGEALHDVLASGVVGGPRAMAMALFQLAVELDDMREELRLAAKNHARIGHLIDRIDSALGAEPMA